MTFREIKYSVTLFFPRSFLEARNVKDRGRDGNKKKQTMAAKRDDDNRKTMESGSNVSFLSPTRGTKEWEGKQKTMFGRREKKQVSASEHSSRGNEHTHI